MALAWLFSCCHFFKQAKDGVFKRVFRRWDCRRKFGGGGHRAASGCLVRVSNLEELFVSE